MRGPHAIDDSYDLRTPEQLDLQYDLAGLGSRFLALLVDLLIQMAVGLAVVAVFAVGVALMSRSFRDLLGSQSDAIAGIGIAVAILLTFVVTWGYFLVFEVIWNGQTPGKRYVGIRVLTTRGEPVTMVHALVRNLMRLIDVLPSSYIIGIVSILVTRRGQRLGDLAAGTIVVRERRAELPGTLPPLDPVLALPPHLAHAFTAEDVRLSRDFLLRAHSLAPDRRAALARQIATTLRARLQTFGQPVPTDLTDERLLRGVAALRS